MKVVKKKKEFNSFNLEGLTSGKLIAIKSALEEQMKNNTITPVGHDVLIALQLEEKKYNG